jgi:hypothetical protein
MDLGVGYYIGSDNGLEMDLRINEIWEEMILAEDIS